MLILFIYLSIIQDTNVLVNNLKYKIVLQRCHVITFYRIILLCQPHTYLHQCAISLKIYVPDVCNNQSTREVSALSGNFTTRVASLKQTCSFVGLLTFDTNFRHFV